jgi:hypothetical protein
LAVCRLVTGMFVVDIVVLPFFGNVGRLLIAVLLGGDYLRLLVLFVVRGNQRFVS